MRTTDLDRMTLCEDGSIEVRFLKNIWDGDKKISDEPHRVVVQPDQTAAQAIEPIAGSLAAIGFPPATADDISHVEKTLKLHRKHPPVAANVEDYKLWRAMEQARAEAEAEEAERQAAVEAEAAEKKRIEDEAAAKEEAAKEEAAAAEAATAAEKKAKDDAESLTKFIAAEVARQVAEAKAAD